MYLLSRKCLSVKKKGIRDSSLFTFPVSQARLNYIYQSGVSVETRAPAVEGLNSACDNANFNYAPETCSLHGLVIFF